MKTAVFFALVWIMSLAGGGTSQVSEKTQDDSAGVDPGITITAPNTGRGSGVVFDYTFRVSNVNGMGIISYEGDVTYDQTILQFNSCGVGGTISVGFMTCNTPSGPGRVKFVYYFSSPLANAIGGPPSDLFKINFTIIGNVGQVSPIVIENLQVMEFSVPGTASPGSVTVLAPTSASVAVAGIVKDSNGRGLGNVRVVLADPSGQRRAIMTGPMGYYRFDGVPVGQVYSLTASSKRHTFQPRSLVVMDEISNADITADQ